MIKKQALKAVAALALSMTTLCAGADTLLYTGGHSLDSARLAALGHTATDIGASDASWNTAFSGGYGRFDAIVVGESSGWTSLQPSTYSAIANYVRNGGHIIVVGDHEGSTSFYNAAFGFAAAAAYGCEYDESVSSTKTAAATGTPFAAGPTSLRDLSCTGALVASTLPSSSKSFYAGAYGGTVFTSCSAEGLTGGKLTMCRSACEVQPVSPTSGAAKVYKAIYREDAPCFATTGTATSQVARTLFGSGKVDWLGWDFCCGSTAYEDDWYIVLDNALR